MAYQIDRGPGFKPSAADPGLHYIYIATESGRIYLLLWVDHILIVARSVEWIKKAVISKFQAHDLGGAHFSLGIDVVGVQCWTHHQAELEKAHD